MYHQDSAEPCTEPLRISELHPDRNSRRSVLRARQPARRSASLGSPLRDDQGHSDQVAAGGASRAQAGVDGKPLAGRVPADGEVLLRELATALEQGLSLPRGPLWLALTHPSWCVRAEAVRLVGLSSEPLIELLLNMLEREAHDTVREAIAWSLGRLIPTFLAHEQLGEARLTRLRATLITLLHADSCWLVREAAAWALGRLGQAAPLGALRQTLLNDSEQEVSAAAAWALAFSGKRLARSYLLEALEKVKLPFLRETIRDALAELNEVLAHTEMPWRQHLPPLRQALLILRDFLEDRRGFLQEPQWLLSEQGPVLVLWCHYQATERRLQEVLDALPRDLRLSASVAPLEAAQCSDDQVLRRLGQLLAEECQQYPCQEALMLSTTICRQTQTTGWVSRFFGEEYACLRVIIIGVSRCEMDHDKPPVLRELAVAWQVTTQEAPLCEQDPCDLRLWYQACRGLASQSQVVHP
ncbi:HEAT repeat domain-containing protein [Thermogemmatispora sp.]|uniref:HEAT repeat domain-containing protein n=1 Tax=Thermogemmatispora sp. TaxID=1968838 RepID=UPI001D832FD5|nr:HEAT repeat domain-containing protein [Thermogemmatispora sp.]MBX5451019.1 HEAT repeat domain-containing protein [Thermogemmatispora sp.]